MLAPQSIGARIGQVASDVPWRKDARPGLACQEPTVRPSSLVPILLREVGGTRAGGRAPLRGWSDRGAAASRSSHSDSSANSATVNVVPAVGCVQGACSGPTAVPGATIASRSLDTRSWGELLAKMSPGSHHAFTHSFAFDPAQRVGAVQERGTDRGPAGVIISAKLGFRKNAMCSAANALRSAPPLPGAASRTPAVIRGSATSTSVPSLGWVSRAPNSIPAVCPPSECPTTGSHAARRLSAFDKRFRLALFTERWLRSVGCGSLDNTRPTPVFPEPPDAAVVSPARPRPTPRCCALPVGVSRAHVPRVELARRPRPATRRPPCAAE